jgi:tetratricopeptide (TPR) repeat protein
MRKSFIALALTLIGFAAWAETPQQVEQCNSSGATADQTVAGCTAMIASGHYKGDDLADAYNNRADGYLGKAKWDLAIADANQSVALKPANPNALNNRCMAYIGKKLFDPAIADCSKAIALSPGNGHYYRNRATAEQKKGQNAKALADYRLAIQIDPKDAFATQGLMSLALPPPGRKAGAPKNANPVAAPHK